MTYISLLTSPEKREYIKVFGAKDLIPEPWFAHPDYKNADEVYRECVKKNITWRKLTGWMYDKLRDVTL